MSPNLEKLNSGSLLSLYFYSKYKNKGDVVGGRCVLEKTLLLESQRYRLKRQYYPKSAMWFLGKLLPLFYTPLSHHDAKSRVVRRIKQLALYEMPVYAWHIVGSQQTVGFKRVTFFFLTIRLTIPVNVENHQQVFVTYKKYIFTLL